jgi:hypothetical protein
MHLRTAAMSITANPEATIVPPRPPSSPRLVLAPARDARAVLDGGWWPRSWDAVAELPGLVLALSNWYRPIRHLMINSDTWDGHFRRLSVGGTVIRIGWFSSQSPAVLIATADAADQLDILVVPPPTASYAAGIAMTAAADPADTRRAPELLAASATLGRHPVDPDAKAVWDNEGGSIVVAA